MSIIVFILNTAEVPGKTLMRLQGATRRSLIDLRGAIAKGKPLYERNIVLGDLEENALSVRAILGCLEELNLPFRIYELPEGETLETCVFSDKSKITVEVLNNILDSSEESRRQQYE